MLGVGTGTWLGLSASLQILGVEMFLIAFFLYIMVIPEVPLPGIDADNGNILGGHEQPVPCLHTKPTTFPPAGADPAPRFPRQKRGELGLLEHFQKILSRHQGDGAEVAGPGSATRRRAQERADGSRGACISESVYNAINSVYP